MVISHSSKKDRSALWLTLLLGAVFYLYEAYRFQTPFFFYDPNSWKRTLVLSTAHGLIALQFFSFLWASFVSHSMLKWFYFLIFTASTATQYGFHKAFESFISVYDIDTALNSDFDLWVESAWLYWSPESLLVCIIYGSILWKKKTNISFSRSLVYLTILGAIILGINGSFYFYKQGGKGGGDFQTTSFGGYIRNWSYTLLDHYLTYTGDRATAIAWKREHAPKKNILFIIDESIHGDHLSINGYKRPTTPFLEGLQQEGVLYTWQDSSAASTCSYQSNVVLWTGISILPDVSYQTRKLPHILQYAKAAQYHTIYLNAQGTLAPPLITPHDLSYIDQIIDADDLAAESSIPKVKRHHYDQLAATKIKSLLAHKKGVFIVLNKKGAHYGYEGSYPKEKTRWTPTHQGQALSKDTSEALINSYDNAIRYSVNDFFKTLLHHSELLDNTDILYTSDHGQTLSKHGETYTHCQTSKPEAVVPIILITKSSKSIDTQFRASHFHTFGTLLELMEVPVEARLYDYEPSLLGAQATDSQPRFYFFGSLHGNGRYQVLPYD